MLRPASSRCVRSFFQGQPTASSSFAASGAKSTDRPLTPVVSASPRCAACRRRCRRNGGRRARLDGCAARSRRRKAAKSSPCSPKPMPGATTTSALSIRSFENSRLPRWRTLRHLTSRRTSTPSASRSSTRRRQSSRSSRRRGACQWRISPMSRSVVEGRRGRHLDRRVGAVIEVGFDAAAGAASIGSLPDREPHAPGGHRRSSTSR